MRGRYRTEKTAAVIPRHMASASTIFELRNMSRASLTMDGSSRVVDAFPFVVEEPEGVVVSCIELLEGDAGRLEEGVLKDSDGVVSVVDVGVAIPSLLFFLDRGLLLKGRRKDI